MAKRKRRNQAKGYKPPSLSEIFEPLVDGWQNIGDSLVWDPNSEYEFGKQMTVKDAKRFRKDYSDPTDVDGSGRRGTISKEYEIAPSKSKPEISQNEIATETTSNETPDVSVSDQLQASNEELNIALQQRADAEKNLLLVKQSAIEKQKIADLGGQEYTTNFQEAFRNANKSQAWEDTMDSDAPLEKSNVFSKAAMDWGMYKAGDTLGVMTRSQRRAYDQAVADAAINKANKANNVVEQDEATGGSGVYQPEADPNKVVEWTTDQKADEAGKVVDAANKIDINQTPTLIPKIEKKEVEL